MSTSNLPHRRLDQLPVEIVNQIVSPLSIKDLGHLEEVYNFKDYSLLELPGVMKPIDAQEAFSDYDLFLKYIKRYQRTFLNNEEIHLALNGGQPQILAYLYQENFLPFETFLATLIIKEEDQYLEELDLKELYPWFDLNPYGIYPSLIVAGIIYVTWGNYSQIQSFFSRYELEDFNEDHWLRTHRYYSKLGMEPNYGGSPLGWINQEASSYENLPLFPYHCTQTEYLDLLNNKLPRLFQQKIVHNVLFQRGLIKTNLLFLGCDLSIFESFIDQNQDFTFLLDKFSQHIPILGQPIIKAPFKMKYSHMGFNFAELPYSKFRNEEALRLILNQNESYFLTHELDHLIEVMKHAIASNLTQLFNYLWDLIDPYLQDDQEDQAKYQYAQIVDASLSVDNPWFFEECQRRNFDLYQITIGLPQLLRADEFGNIGQIFYSPNDLLKYFFTYHRWIVFERIKSALGLDLLASLNELPKIFDPLDLVQILGSNFHYGTLINFFKSKKDSQLDQGDWKFIINKFSTSFENYIINRKFLDLTWVTDQPILHFSDLMLKIRSLIPSDLPFYRLFFDKQLEGTKFLLDLIYNDSLDLWKIIYYLELPKFMDDLKIKGHDARQQFKLKVIRIILKIIQRDSNLKGMPPPNLTYGCLEILREESSPDFIVYKNQFKSRYFGSNRHMINTRLLFNYMDRPGFMRFIEYISSD